MPERGIGVLSGAQQVRWYKDCPVLSKEWGNGLWRLFVGDCIGIHSPIPY